MKTFEVEVTQVVHLTIDETKFTKEFIEEFSSYMFHTDCIEDHIKHLSQLAAREMLDYDFIEGYGDPQDFGIKYTIIDSNEEIIEEIVG